MYIPLRIKTAGFSIIELIVVLSIIIFILSAATYSFTSINTRARDSARVGDINQLKSALQLYYNDNNRYPATLAGTGLVPNYIKAMPIDPKSRQEYSYAALIEGDNCSNYHLGALLENVSPGTEQLASDFDATASLNACVGSAPDFNGTDPIYDIRP
ncbi:MAG: type II secretion system protein [Patescibacteria group bacterium]